MKLENAVEDSDEKKTIVEIPLLFENNLEENFYYTICVLLPKTQKERLLHRGLTKDESNDRIRSQLPTKEKSRLADIVLLGEGSFIVSQTTNLLPSRKHF